MRTYTAMTAPRAAKLGLNPPRDYGYVVRVEPPILTNSHGQDVEGIGWVAMLAKKNVQHIYGWYKDASVAKGCAITLNRYGK